MYLILNLQVFQILRNSLHRTLVFFVAAYKYTPGGCRDDVTSSSVTSSIHTGHSHIILRHIRSAMCRLSVK